MFIGQLKDWSSVRVAVVGDVMLDRYWQGQVSRVSPEAPVPVVSISDQHDRPGGAANVAVNLAKLGVSVRLFGVIGDDAAGAQLVQQLAIEGIGDHLQRAPGAVTTTKLRVLGMHQQMIRCDFEQSLADRVDHRALLAQFIQQLDQCDVVVISDYAKGVLPQAQDYIEAARQAGLPVLVDPKGVDWQRYRGATLLTPNRKEFEQVVGVCADHEAMVQPGQQLCCDLQLDQLLITLGEEGMLLLSALGMQQAVPAQVQSVYDVTGAGDTVIAVCAAAYAAGHSMEEAMTIANVAAGLVVKQLAAGSVTREMLSAVLRAAGGVPLRSCAELKRELAQLKQEGRSCVMTNGCFDVIHAGHVDYLSAAKALGDILVVAVNDDASVRRLKGASRPVHCLDDRLLVLAGLRAVDYLVVFSEDTPEHLIGQLLPDVLVKGADYQLEEIAGADAVLAAGGEVRTLALRAGCSTSRVLERLGG